MRLQTFSISFFLCFSLTLAQTLPSPLRPLPTDGVGTTDPSVPTGVTLPINPTGTPSTNASSTAVPTSSGNTTNTSTTNTTSTENTSQTTQSSTTTSSTSTPDPPPPPPTKPPATSTPNPPQTNSSTSSSTQMSSTTTETSTFTVIPTETDSNTVPSQDANSQSATSQAPSSQVRVWVIVGCVLGALVLAAAIWLCRRRLRRNRSLDDDDPEPAFFEQQNDDMSFMDRALSPETRRDPETTTLVTQSTGFIEDTNIQRYAVPPTPLGPRMPNLPQGIARSITRVIPRSSSPSPKRSVSIRVSPDTASEMERSAYVSSGSWESTDEKRYSSSRRPLPHAPGDDESQASPITPAAQTEFLRARVSALERDRALNTGMVAEIMRLREENQYWREQITTDWSTDKKDNDYGMPPPYVTA